MSGENLYYLMHKDKIVTVVEIENVSGNIIKVSPKMKKDLLPLGGNLSPEDLKRWWARRAVPLKQGNIERILALHGIPTIQNYLLKNAGLSLTDHYWIRPVESILTWEDVNLFTNDFRDAFEEIWSEREDIGFGRIDLRGKTVFYPGASLQGELQKKWVIQNGKRYLIKGNYGVSSQQSINEVIASCFHKNQGRIDYTEYRLCNIDVEERNGLGCICKNFADSQIEFIPAYDVVCSQKKRNDLSEYEHFIKICVQHGLKESYVRDFLEYQILSDFVITNTDRHFNNFGVLRDSDTLRFIQMAPIFDSGNSMFWNRTDMTKDETLLDISITSFRKREADQLQYVTNPEFLEKFQKGEKIWAYGYHG